MPHIESDESDYSGEGSGVSDEVPEERLKVVIRPRGNPRGRPKGSGSGTGRPRGRPKGSTNRIKLTLKRPPTPSDEGVDYEEDLEIPADSPVVIEPIGDAAAAPDAPKPYVIVNGVQYAVSRDNLETLENDIGNTKVDVNGNLFGGREFKTNTFTVPTRNNDVKYMLAIDCARACGYRDSLYYFRRNPMMLKLNLSQAEKEYLIDLSKLHTNLRHRSVTMVTARSAFKQHGAKIVRNGRWVIDDYYEDYARKECEEKGFKPGDVVQEPAEPIGYTSTTAADIIVKGAKESRTGIYKAGGPTTFFGSDGVGPFRGEMSSTKKAMLARENLTEENWMAACAYSVWECNDELRAEREGRVVAGARVEETRFRFGPGDRWSTTIYTAAAMPAEGATKGDDMDAALKKEEEAMTFDWDSADEAAATQAKASLAARQAALYKPRAAYEVHTGQVHYPQDKQPTQLRWEHMPEDKHMYVVGGNSKVGTTAWGIAYIDYIMEGEDIAPVEAKKDEEMRKLVEEAERDGPSRMVFT